MHLKQLRTYALLYSIVQNLHFTFMISSLKSIVIRIRFIIKAHTFFIKQIIVHFPCYIFIHGLGSLVHHSKEKLFKGFLPVQGVRREVGFTNLHGTNRIVLGYRPTPKRLVIQKEMGRHHRIKRGTNCRSESIGRPWIQIYVVSIVERIRLRPEVELRENLGSQECRQQF